MMNNDAKTWTRTTAEREVMTVSPERARELVDELLRLATSEGELDAVFAAMSDEESEALHHLAGDIQTVTLVRRLRRFGLLPVE